MDVPMAMGRPKAVIGASGQAYFVERFWEDEPGNCSTAGDQQGHGKSVAVPIPQA
jgi:hypothetical protein